MSTNTFNPVYTPHGSASLGRRRGHPHFPNPHITKIRTLSQPPLSIPISQNLVYIISSAVSSAAASSTSTTEVGGVVSFDVLRQHLVAGDWREADEETRRLLIVLAGEAAEKRGYVFFSEVQFMTVQDLRTMDSLWREHSGGRFGYSVQKRIWEKSNREFTKFFIKIGWMKKLESTEVKQYNYRAFPTEFTWDLEEAMEGHLPLTNALRGMQLLTAILTHPAFEEGEPGSEEVKRGVGPGGGSSGFKPSY